MAEFVHVYNDGGGIRNVPMREGATRLTTDRVLYQSGVPWYIPAGDGGSNGLSFTGTRGVFTLSAESPMTGSFNVLTSGGYCYLPAGAGGLATGGWYWFRMTDGTNGEVFAETYSGTGQPAFVSSPTSLPNLSAGRITQGITEILGPSFTMPGGSMGPNGTTVAKLKWFATNSATNKTLRIRFGSSDTLRFSVTTGNLDQLVSSTRSNMGVVNQQIGNRTNATSSAWDGGSSAPTYSGDVTTVDTSVDQTISFSGQLGANTDSLIIIPLQFIVQYGG